MESFVVSDKVSMADSWADTQLSIELLLHTALLEHLQWLQLFALFRSHQFHIAEPSTVDDRNTTQSIGTPSAPNDLFHIIISYNYTSISYRGWDAMGFPTPIAQVSPTQTLLTLLYTLCYNVCSNPSSVSAPSFSSSMILFETLVHVYIYISLLCLVLLIV